MGKKRILVNAVLLLLAIPAFTQVRTLQPFKAGDRIAFMGNSITEAGYYESYIWLYYMLHYPGRRLTILNAGIGGDRAKNMADRFDDDLLPMKATVICLTFGMNDTGYFEFLWANADSSAKARILESEHYFTILRKKLNALPAVQKISMGSSPFDETVKGPKNNFPKKTEAMEAIAAFQQKAADEDHWGWVDFFHPMTVIDQREQKKDSTFTLTGPDRIHPGNAGHFVMAYLFLKKQGLTGTPVADIRVDAGKKRLTGTINCTVTNLSVRPNDIQFDYLAASLPFPADTIARNWGNPQRQSQALDVIPFTEEFNKEMLQVKGLQAGNFAVTIDGRPIGTWTDADLAKGINLATLANTPEYDQAMVILWLNEQRMALESKLRAYYWLQFNFFRDIGLLYKDSPAAMDSVNARATKDWAVASKRDNYREARYPIVRESWKKQMKAIIDEIYTVNQPLKHRIRIKAM